MIQSIVVLSDIHGEHWQAMDKWPAECFKGDLLICAGDITSDGTLRGLLDFKEFLTRIMDDFRHIVIVAGNHDHCFIEKNRQCRESLKEYHYLEDESVNIEGMKIYGSPWQPWSRDELKDEKWSFGLRRGSVDLQKKWKRIPDNTDILITHCPPRGILDKVCGTRHHGCELLRKRLEQIHPVLHCFGHIHEDNGIDKESLPGSIFVNACIYPIKIKEFSV